MDNRGIDVGNGSVIAEDAAIPDAPHKPNSRVAESVVDATIKADVRPPVSGVPNVKAFAPSPVAGGPQ